jgi:hypothetical protein
MLPRVCDPPVVGVSFTFPRPHNSGGHISPTTPTRSSPRPTATSRYFRRKTVTPLWTYYPPILQALEAVGGNLYWRIARFGVSRRSAHLEVLYGRPGCNHYSRDGCIAYFLQGRASDGDD